MDANWREQMALEVKKMTPSELQKGLEELELQLEQKQKELEAVRLKRAQAVQRLKEHNANQEKIIDDGIKRLVESDPSLQVIVDEFNAKHEDPLF